MTSTSRNCGGLAAFGFAAVLTVSQAVAQDIDDNQSEVGGGSDWDFYLGAGVGYVPEYEGSDKYDAKPFPAFEIVWRDKFVVSASGIGAFIYDQDGFRASAALGYGGGRDENDSNYLKGLGDIDNGAVISLGAQLDLGSMLAATADVQKYLRGSKGTVVSVGLQSQVPFGVIRGALSPTGNRDSGVSSQRDLVLIGGVSLNWADDDYNNSFYSVSSAQSASSGLRQYTVESGINSVNAEIGFSKSLGENWGVTGLVQYSRFLGDAADSPIVKSRQSYAAVLAVGYQF